MTSRERNHVQDLHETSRVIDNVQVALLQIIEEADGGQRWDDLKHYRECTELIERIARQQYFNMTGKQSR